MGRRTPRDRGADPLPQAGQEGLPEQPHEPGAHHQVGLPGGGGLGQGSVPVPTGGIVPEPDHGPLHTGGIGVSEPRAVLIGQDPTTRAP